MFDKIKEGLNNYSQNAEDAQNRVNEQVKELFTNNVENSDDYIIGVGQIETEDKSGKATVVKIVSNSVMITWQDYIIGVNKNKKELVVLEIEDGAVTNKQVFEDDFTVKKDTLIGNELKNTLKRFSGVRQRRSGDRYKRDEFTIKSADTKLVLLVGNFMYEASNYSYDNTALIQSLKDLKNK